MASYPPFELEDQTDEDFFDKLVNDDDDVSSKTTGLIKANDVLDGNESDELKAFANLSIGEISIENSSESESKGLMVSDEVRETKFVDGEPNSTLASEEEDGVTAFEVKTTLRTEVSCSHTSGVKQVQWSAFADLDNNGDDFFASLGEGEMETLQTESTNMATAVPGYVAEKNATIESAYNPADYQGTTGDITKQSSNENSVEYWESLYPGWKYDPNSGQWYQSRSVETVNGQEIFAENVQGTFGASGDSAWATSDVLSSQLSYAQQTAQSAVKTVNQASTTENVSDWNCKLQPNSNYQYPAHMVFDSQYPGWYYDTLAQEWHSLELYHSSVQSADQIGSQQAQNGFHPSVDLHCGSQGFNNDRLPDPSSKGLGKTPSVEYCQQGTNAQFGTASRYITQSTVAHSWQSSNEFNIYSNSLVGQLSSGSTGALTTSEQTSLSNDNSNWVSGLNNFSADNNFQLFNHTPQVQQNGSGQYRTDFYSSQYLDTVGQSVYCNGHNVAPTEGRPSAGRPPHALVTFGFGGKLVVMKDNADEFSTLGSKNGDGCFLSVLNLMEVVSLNDVSSGTKTRSCSYFHSLCHQSFPGPLGGGNVGNKELYKWIDEKIANCESLETNYGKNQGLKLLLSLLKIACQHYGKLRSFGGDTGLKENDLPESAVAELFASAKRNDDHFSEFNAISKCVMTLPSEEHIQATATEVQSLLISGRKMEALQRAQQGQFWGFALILARQLGEQFYADTVKQMAASQLVVGSPLRTLCLLIARKPEDVFSNSVMPSGNVYGAVHMSPQPLQKSGSSMLDNWEENLAVITANRTENDHLVIMHLGDCLLKEKNDVTAAHICYLVAEAGFELYSDSARLCLIGADHWNFPRTYASPEAIQRTELFEYAKILGNSQFVLLQLQPYKLIYAHMLAEVGRVSDSLKYCQTVYKSLKIGRSLEADTLKQLLSTLEERIRTHQQSGYAANLAPGKIVGKLLNFFDSTAHRVVGGFPPSGPSATMQNNFQGNENQLESPGPKINGSQSIMGAPSLTSSSSMDMVSSQSTMVLSSLTPSASMEPINNWAVDGSKMTLQNRSISEPDIGRSPEPDQVNSSNEATSSSTVGKQSDSTSTGKSRLGRLNFGAQLLQKTVGLVLKPRQGRQAKLGDTNKFYYDEKLKRWVEEGAEPPPEVSAPPPPPTTAAIQNGKSGYNLKNALSNGLHAIDGSTGSISSTPESSPGIPSSLPSSNQFSVRNRMGVRSRYVDTFNKGGGVSTNVFQAPSTVSAKPATLTRAKFFIPTAAPTKEETLSTEAGSRNEESESGENSFMSTNDPFQKLAPSPAGTMQRFASVDSIPCDGTMGSGKSSFAPHSRRASWSAIPNGVYAPRPTTEMKASPISLMSSISSNQMAGSLFMHRGNSGDDLQEVEL